MVLPFLDYLKALCFVFFWQFLSLDKKVTRNCCEELKVLFFFPFFFLLLNHTRIPFGAVKSFK